MLSSRVWMITGTSSGFGRRLVRIALARGDRVIATAKSLTNISHFLEEPEVPKSNIRCAELDISSGTELVKKRVETIIQRSGWGTVDVLVNNAGFSTPAFVEEGGVELMRRQYQTNLFGTLDVTTAVLPYMRKQRSGTVVVMGSRSVWKPEVKVGSPETTQFKSVIVGVLFSAFYASSKAALRVIAENMAAELEPFGIRILIVEPGSFRTEGIYRQHFIESTRNIIPDYDDKREAAEREYRTPAGKQRGDPVKAMKALVEVVCGEGRAQGKAWPLYLVLGKDAEQDVRKKCARMIRHLDEWGDMVRDVDLDNVN